MHLNIIVIIDITCSKGGYFQNSRRLSSLISLASGSFRTYFKVFNCKITAPPGGIMPKTMYTSSIQTSFKLILIVFSYNYKSNLQSLAFIDSVIVMLKVGTLKYRLQSVVQRDTSFK